jgi:hypothetical protein
MSRAGEYDAFISYSHAADSRLAAALERGLERLARPWNRLRAMSVFRDENDLTLNPDLWGMISSRLERARYLVLLLSPEAAASPWVNKEAAHYCDVRGSDHVLLVWTAGHLEWDDAEDDFTTDSTAVPEALRRRFRQEPLYLDLRWAREQAELSLALPRFRTAVAQVAAPIRNTTPAEIEGEDVRRRRHARRLARGAVAVVLTLAIIATLAAVVAVRNAQRADRRTREAVARQIGLAALDLPASEIDQAFLMSLASSGLASPDDPGRFQPAQVLIGRYSRLDKLLHLAAGEQYVNVRSLAFGSGASIVGTVGRSDGSSALATWSESSRVARVSALPGDAGNMLVATRAGLLVGGGAGGAVVIDQSATTAALAGPILDADEGSGAAWVSDAAGDPVLVRVADGSVVVAAPGAAPSAIDVRGDRAAAVIDGAVTSIDADTGAVLARSVDQPPGSVIALAPDDAVALVDVGPDRTIRAWRRDGDALTIGDSAPVPDQVGTPTWLAVSPGGERVLVVGTSGTALVHLPSGSAVLSPGGGTTVTASDPSGRFVALGGSRLSVWDMQAGQRTVAVPQLTAALDWSGPCDVPPRCMLAAAGIAIDVIDPIAETQVRLVEEIGAQAIAIANDGKTVASGGWGTTVALWSVDPSIDDTSRRALSEADLDAVSAPDGATAARAGCGEGLGAFSPGAVYAVSVDPASAATSLCRIEGDPARVALARLNPDAGTVTAVAVDDGGQVALGRSSGIIEYYPSVDGQFQRGKAIDVRAGGESVHVASLAARGGVVVAGIVLPGTLATPARVTIWKVDDGQPTSFATDHADVAAVALLDREASALIVAGRDDPDGPVTIQLWETESRRRIGRALSGLAGDVTRLIGLDSAVVGVDEIGSAFEWEIERDPTRDVCAIVGRSLDADEWHELAGGALRAYAYDDPCSS